MSAEAEIRALATRQHGLITSHQLGSLGAPPGFAARRCTSGSWTRLRRGIYVVGAAPPTQERRLMAALLAAGPGALLSHRGATRLWELHGRKAAPVELSIPRGRRHRPRGIVVHEVRDLELAGACLRAGLPCTGLARTILDLGAVEPNQVRSAVWAARRTHGLEWAELLNVLATHSRQGRPGIGPLREVVAQHYGELAGDSATEDHAHALLVESGRVPRPERLVAAMCADGVEVTADLGWPRWRALIEVQGVDHFTNEDLQQTDLHRRNQLNLAGYHVLYVSGRQLRRAPDQFVADVVALLRAAGWHPGQV